MAMNMTKAQLDALPETDQWAIVIGHGAAIDLPKSEVKPESKPEASSAKSK